jgi:hypothetical protein
MDISNTLTSEMTDAEWKYFCKTTETEWSEGLVAEFGLSKRQAKKRAVNEVEAWLGCEGYTERDERIARKRGGN